MKAASRIEDLGPGAGDQTPGSYYGDRVWELIPEEIGIRLDRRAVLEEAYGVGRKGSLLEQVRERWQVWRRGQEIELSLLVDERGGRNILPPWPGR